jgi:amidase
LLIAALTPVSAQRTIDLDQATIADVNAAFAKGTLTSERLTQIFLSRLDAYGRKGPGPPAVPGGDEVLGGGVAAGNFAMRLGG